MPFVSALFVSPHTVPLLVAIKVTPDNIDEVGKSLVGANVALATTKLSFGTLLSANDLDFPINPVTKALVKQLSVDHNNAYDPRGRCLILGLVDEKGAFQNVDKTIIEASFRVYQELTGKAVNGRNTRKHLGPNRSKRDYDFFSHDFQCAVRADLKAKGEAADFVTISHQTRLAWHALPAEEKLKYENLARDDKLRYKTQMAAYRLTNPIKPKHPRNAYNLYCQAFPDKKTRQDWKVLSEETKAPYNQQAQADKVRFEQQAAFFKKHCEETGKDFEEMMRRKPRKIVIEASGESVAKAAKVVAVDTKAEKPKRVRKPKVVVDGEAPKRSRKPKVVDGEEPKKRVRKPKVKKVSEEVEVA